MTLTLAAKIKIIPTSEQENTLRQTAHAYRDACNSVSEVVFNENTLVQAKLHKWTYKELRSTFGLKSQMAQSVLKTVIAKYKTNKSNGHERSKVQFKKPQFDLVFNRDYSLTKGLLSVNTLEGRIKVPFHTEGLESYFDGRWTFGTAKLVNKYGKWFLHIPVSKEIEEANLHNINQVVGIDMGVNFTATTFDSEENSRFFSGKQITIKRNRSTRKPLDARRESLYQQGTR